MGAIWNGTPTENTTSCTTEVSTCSPILRDYAFSGKPVLTNTTEPVTSGKPQERNFRCSGSSKNTTNGLTKHRTTNGITESETWKDWRNGSGNRKIVTNGSHHGACCNVGCLVYTAMIGGFLFVRPIQPFHAKCCTASINVVLLITWIVLISSSRCHTGFVPTSNTTNDHVGTSKTLR